MKADLKNPQKAREYVGGVAKKALETPGLSLTASYLESAKGLDCLDEVILPLAAAIDGFDLDAPHKGKKNRRARSRQGILRE